MKYRDLIRKLKDGGFVFARAGGGSHEIWIRGTQSVCIPNGGHKEVNRMLAQRILKEVGLWEKK